MSLEKKRICRVVMDFEIVSNISIENFARGVVETMEEAYNSTYGPENKVKLIGVTTEYGKGHEYYAKK